ncbi:MAG: hypothetical protein AVDCRST_MAG53-2432, partial [uncultured Solirubrobacteraceae bacterium]
ELPSGSPPRRRPGHGERHPPVPPGAARRPARFGQRRPRLRRHELRLPRAPDLPRGAARRGDRCDRRPQGVRDRPGRGCARRRRRASRRPPGRGLARRPLLDVVARASRRGAVRRAGLPGLPLAAHARTRPPGRRSGRDAAVLRRGRRCGHRRAERPLPAPGARRPGPADPPAARGPAARGREVRRPAHPEV